MMGEENGTLLFMNNNVDSSSPAEGENVKQLV